MNYSLFSLINGWAGRSDGLDDVMEFLATALIYVVFAVAAGLVVHALFRRRLRALALIGASLVLAFAAATMVSHLSGQVRPFQTHRVHQLIAHTAGVSLPSDHATAAFTIAAGIGVFLHRGWALALGVCALAIGFARVWVGVHYPGDILAGFVIAVAAVVVVAVADRFLRRRQAHAQAL
ncbi:undecaprenyl-diphosphatase [Hamadaea flava]|uniref:Phosphatase PAP2 family protein n=1 Tax=Hamadaea flava TaxID=1742688 RepID=A0ABV8M094_9ACTN|nr:phosphatase PAP2 family protein [Hamadaea flava]MCP2323494.1 undecaprenyl-diphosphatase [Hamadaea flava]